MIHLDANLQRSSDVCSQGLAHRRVGTIGRLPPCNFSGVRRTLLLALVVVFVVVEHCFERSKLVVVVVVVLLSQLSVPS